MASGVFQVDSLDTSVLEVLQHGCWKTVLTFWLIVVEWLEVQPLSS